MTTVTIENDVTVTTVTVEDLLLENLEVVTDRDHDLLLTIKIDIVHERDLARGLVLETMVLETDHVHQILELNLGTMIATAVKVATAIVHLILIATAIKIATAIVRLRL